MTSSMSQRQILIQKLQGVVSEVDFSPPHAHIGNMLACACPQTFNYINLRWCGIQGAFFFFLWLFDVFSLVSLWEAQCNTSWECPQSCSKFADIYLIGDISQPSGHSLSPQINHPCLLPGWNNILLSTQPGCFVGCVC